MVPPAARHFVLAVLAGGALGSVRRMATRGVVALALLALACSGSGSGSRGSTGSGGSFEAGASGGAGTGGVAGTSGVAGADAGGGANGASGASGSGGSSGRGGTAGAAGAGGSAGSSSVNLGVLWDTAWTLDLSSQSKIHAYLDARKSQGFDVVMMNYGDFDVENTALGNGQTPFLATFGASSPVADVLKPNDAGWKFVDATIAYATSHGLAVCLLPVGNSGAKAYVRALSDKSNGENRAFKYGQWLGNRYKATPGLIWMLGGDVDPTVAQVVPLTNSLASGIRSTGDTHAMTFQPNHGKSSSTWFGARSWLTFNAIQSRPLDPSLVTTDLGLSPPKPTGVAESGYETTSYGSDETPGQVLSNTWQGYLTGASYVAYGQAGMYQGQNTATTNGIAFARIARDEVAKRGWLSYTPTADFVTASSGTVTPMRKANKAAMIYLGSGASVTVDMSSLDATGNVRVQRFNPRSGASTSLGTFAASGTHAFTGGSLSDAVLLLDAV